MMSPYNYGTSNFYSVQYDSVTTNVFLVVVLNKEWRLSVPEAAFNSSSSDTTFLFPSANTRRTETYFYSYKILVTHIRTALHAVQCMILW